MGNQQEKTRWVNVFAEPGDPKYALMQDFISPKPHVPFHIKGL